MCTSRDVSKFQKRFNDAYPDQMFMGILLDGSEMTQDKLVLEIERLIGNQFDKNAAYQRHDPN